MAESSWINEFPAMDRGTLRDIRKALDESYRSFSREYGDTIESFFDPLLSFLVWFEKLLLATPWWLVVIIVTVLAFLAGRSWKLCLGVVVSFLAIGYFGMWEDTMRTLSIITVCTLLAIGIGIPIGILMARSNRAQNIITPLLDVMQTMPAFVYLIPVVMLLGIGKIPGLIAVIIYAIPPVIRLTNLGIRLVDKEVLEAATAYGANKTQRLIGVQLPLAMPTIMAGVNQTIMMALSMVVIASMIGVKGLGQPVLKSITNQYFALGLLNGLAIVALAIIFDRISQAYAKRTQEHLGGHS
ncbi:proline/glycine betaine ABC transporter permease [Neptunomonas phycophila]|jgi:glycine betaine/proline transport system permease protein|uniref:Proline/glycine betaine ABC transporter permease n=1 Tax=Neptunomonas phycophila TaxID=1572645 RepID=A0AAW7XF84_9GAMM|nr:MULTISPECIES: proline/glycine betaine ABC transporter permease [Neptunomonas]MBT3147110.1 proline/glycine betaine ABC transporter permease [Neptunomonas phycophila]MDN2658520.1 proline/glycine betaine ABC transporter permease [Neptunomonas sp. CHC150]MDO6452909.1 proline/glycine betaine ABC transporter permease [Neptunomonas phycophila]MDO6467445.1 proline/glycine betaine ABC transporter permease [Neptunomonas phycophila]MDP2521459.1 proline/glycine betaine ABC transporter permease [Neptuno